MTDTCNRCHRPMAADESEWTNDLSALCVDIKEVFWMNQDTAKQYCDAARDRWLVAEIARLTAELEAEREAHCWDYSPAMAQAAIDGHVATIDRLRATIERVRQACQAPRPHRTDCDRVLHDDGDCTCGAWAQESFGAEMLALLGEP